MNVILSVLATGGCDSEYAAIRCDNLIELDGYMLFFSV